MFWSIRHRENAWIDKLVAVTEVRQGPVPVAAVGAAVA